MAQFNLKICKSCGNEFRQYTSLDKCKCRSSKPQPKQKKAYVIPQVSKKRKVEMLQYSVLRTEFLAKKENQVCPITKQQTIEVHHTYCGKDRAKNYLDVSTWLAVSREGHNWIHDNPKEARELGYLK
jgi:hypothetical protein